MKRVIYICDFCKKEQYWEGKTNFEEPKVLNILAGDEVCNDCLFKASKLLYENRDKENNI